jgi:hypothetical protein
VISDSDVGYLSICLRPLELPGIEMPYFFDDILQCCHRYMM